MGEKASYEELEFKVKTLESENIQLKKAVTSFQKPFNGYENHIKNNTEDIDLRSIINIEEIQSIMDDFHFLTGMVTAVLDIKGNIIEATGWKDICTRFHRIHPDTASNCTESDLYLSKNLKPGEYVDYKCKNGLWDVVTPLYVEGKHLGNIYTGQFFYHDDKIDEGFFIRQAQKYGFDRSKYIKALRNIPRYDKDTVDHLMSFLAKFTAYISKVGASNKRLAKEVAERKRSERALIKSETRLRAIFEAASKVSFMVTDATNPAPVIHDFSPGSEKIFGYHKEEVIGKPVSIFHIKEDEERFPQIFQQMAGGKTGFSEEIIMVRKSGEKFPAMLSTYPLIDEKGNMYATLGVSFDMTEQKKLENQLFQSYKMESIGRLAGGIAHDFNNMLSIILTNIELMLDDMTPDNPFIESILEIRKASERSAELTSQLLAFARKQTIAPKLSDLNEVICGMLKMLERTIGENIRLIWRPGKELWPVKVDSSQVSQMLVNLCINSRDSITGTGQITIETGNISFDDEYCLYHKGFNPGDYTMIVVSDSGCGMDKETMDNLFEPFFTTKGIGHGTGLGLAMVYGIVKQNNGFINVYSEIGKGSVFKIFLPRIAGHLPQQSIVEQEAITGHETILLVEDEESILKATTRMLEHLGYTVLPVSNPVAALGIYKSNQEKIDMLMTDVVMPEMSGRKLAEKLREINPNIKCLYMSGYTDNIIAKHGILEEDDRLITKPFSKNKLSAKLREIFG
jgi:PAS domain S-box-containing protein